MLADDAEPEWYVDALCAQTDPDAFFPEAGVHPWRAKRVCQICMVRPECLEYALEENEEYGVWGGLTGDERRRLKRRRSNAAARS